MAGKKKKKHKTNKHPNISTSNFSKVGPGTPSTVVRGESDTIGFTMIAGIDMSMYL